MSHYVHDENHNRILAYSAEEVLSVLAQAIEDGDLDNITADAAFITRLKSIADGKTYKVAFLTQAEYNALEQAEELEDNTLYYITDDSTLDDLTSAFENVSEDVLQLQSDVRELEEFAGGIGVDFPISSYVDQATQEPYYYADIQKKGLYACVIKTIDAPHIFTTVMISVFDLDQTTYSTDANSRVVYLKSQNNQRIQTFFQNEDYQLVSCRLIVPYEDAQ